jgi:hypothetical protein
LISETLEGFSKDNSGDLSEAVVSGYNHLAKTQSIGLNPTANSFCDVIYVFLPNRLKDLVSIRYDRGLIKQMDKISGDLNYKNPVTGEVFKKSLDTLLNDSVEKSVDFCLNIEKFIINKRSLVLTYEGPSLKSGISDSTVKDMKYFSPQPIIV